MPRTILHLDLDAFFCAVEEIREPGLRGKPFAVAGRPDQRGVVASCSYAARAFGVRSAMPTARALRLCPNLIIVNSRHHLYGEVSGQVMDRLNRVTPLVEQISIDEAFLDITDLQGPASEIARRIQNQIRAELSLPSSIGVASNKLVAKIATEVGKKSAAELGIHTIGDIARWNESDLVRRFGEHGRDLHRHAQGLDERPITTEREAKSISQETTFARDLRADRELEKVLHQLSAQVGHQLRESELVGRTIKLKLRWPDFTTLTRQATLTVPTDNDDAISSTAVKLLQAVRKSNQAVRLIGVGVSGLTRPVRQLELWDNGTEKARNLQNAVDELRNKFGRRIIRHGDF